MVSDDWHGFRGDAARASVGRQGPTGSPVVNWQAKAGGAVPDNLAIVGDVVYFTSDDRILHAVSRATGAELWMQELANGTAPGAGPVVADGRIYLMDGSGATEALDPNGGNVLWQGRTRYDSPSQLVSADETLYLGTGDGLLVALDATNGAERWKVELSPDGAQVHNPAAADGFVYAGTAGAGFFAVDATTHEIAWTADLHGDDPGTASVNDGIAYIASNVDAPTGALHAFDAKTGTHLWDGPSPLLQAPTVIDGTAFSATRDGLLDAIDTTTGALRWSIQITGDIRPMAGAGSTLFLSADEEQRVYAVETSTGHKLWQLDVDGRSDCCIAVAQGAVYVGTMTGSVYSVGGDGASVAAVPFASAPPTAGSSPAGVAPTAATIDAKVDWSTDLAGKGFAPISQIAVDPKGRIWAPEANADTIAIFDADGTLLEEWGSTGDGPGQFDFTRQNGDGYGTLAFAEDGSFFVLDVGNRRVQAFDPKRKFVSEWGGFGTSPGKFDDPIGIGVAKDGTVWVLDDRRGVIEHYDAKGTVLGSIDPFTNGPSKGEANSLALDADGHLYVTQIEPNQVAEFDTDGTLIRTFGSDGAFREQPTQMAIDAVGRLYVTQGMSRGDLSGVTVFAPGGAVLGGFGPVGVEGAGMQFPGGIAVDGKGGVYVEDSLPESARLIRFALPKSMP
jgi:outer membrane protein assembly factor BamB